MIWKSKNEFLRFKTKEKALMYMTGLVEMYRNQEPCLADKLDYIFAVNFPMRY